MNEKQYASVICEYNPFHFGHLYQLEQLKKEFSGIICILSGNIVQRGSVAVADKYIRAKAALNSGADLVLELPVPWCCASARDFASAGVHIADSVGSNYLAFGAENDLEDILSLEKYISSKEFAEDLNEYTAQNKNASYPVALKALVTRAFGEAFGEIIAKPNNILALEYVSALKGRSLSPYAVKRDSQYKSSSQIRAFGNEDEILAQLPPQSQAVFKAEKGSDFCRNAKRLNSFFVGRLRLMAAEKADFAGLYALTDDLAKKILANSTKYSDINDIILACTDKVYTQARVRRAVNSLVFGIKANAVNASPTYTCVLAANNIGREILRNAKKHSSIDIITKPVHALSCCEATKKAFAFAKGIEDIIALSSPVPAPADMGKTPFITGE